MAQEYIIYCDESEEKGRYFSNFYGGALVRSQDIDAVRASILAKKQELNLFDEVKWQKITKNYQQKYIDLMSHFFELISAKKVKIRIMFTQNTVVPQNLSERHVDEKYFILYYQFIKHAFGLKYSPYLEGGVNLRIYVDKMPDTAERIARFKSFLVALSTTADFRQVGIKIKPENVAEVISHDHDVMQCLDIVLGSIHFRLNDKHKVKPKGKKQRANRTVAKHAVYKHINELIRSIHTNFNIGITTGHRDSIENRWNHAYRHWLFTPTERIIRPGGKPK